VKTWRSIEAGIEGLIFNRTIACVPDQEYVCAINRNSSIAVGVAP
jgi:hypothetical protein